jgi:ribonuclease P/MRP protein subunit POP1
MVIWKPAQSTAGPESAEGLSATAKLSKCSQKKKPKSKGKSKAGPSEPDVRTVWIRSHPVAFSEVFSALQLSASVTLDAIKQSSSTTQSPRTEVEIADLREQVNVFEIMGPKSSQVLKGALTPVGEDKREEFKKVCGLRTLTNRQHTDGSGGHSSGLP